MIKQIVLQIGRKIVDFCAWLEVGIIAITLIVFIFFTWSSEIEISNKVLITVISLFVGLVLFMLSILVKYLTYLIIDIKDNTAKIAGVEENDINKNISKIFLDFVAVLLATIFAGLIFCGFDYLNKTLLDKEGNFTIIELNNKIKQISKYSDTINRKTYGFIYNPENVQELKILEITSKSSAEKEGLKKGDIIVKVNDYNISTGYDEKKLRKIFKKNKNIKVTYLRNSKTNTVELSRDNVVIPNITSSREVNIYANSMDFKNNYALGVFKTSHSDGSYTKDITVCDCNPQHKTVMTIWNADYINGSVTREYNALKEKTVNEDFVIPNTFGYIKWYVVCTANNDWSDKMKKNYKESVKHTK